MFLVRGLCSLVDPVETSRLTTYKMVKSINLLHSKDGYPNNYQNRRNPRRSRTGHWCFWRPPFPDANFTQWNWRVFCVWSEPFNVSTLSDTAQSRLFFWNVCPAVYSFRWHRQVPLVGRGVIIINHTIDTTDWNIFKGTITWNAVRSDRHDPGRILIGVQMKWMK